MTATTTKSVDNAPLLQQLEAAYFELQPSHKTRVAALLNEAQHLTGDNAKAFVLAALSWCQRLYVEGRSAEAIPLARLLTTLAADHADTLMQHRAATAYGNVLLDSGAKTAAIQQYAYALQLAELMGEARSIARAWFNIGTVFFIAGVNLLAFEAFGRVEDLLPACHDASLQHKTYLHLALCHLHEKEYRQGLVVIQKAMQIETPTIFEAYPLSATLLRANYIQLLLRVGRHNDIDRLLDEIIRLGESHPYPRVQISVLLARGSVAVAKGHFDAGLTHLCAALSLARHYPAELNDSLLALHQAEQQAGHAGEAAHYLAELTELVHTEAIAEAQRLVSLPTIFDDAAIMAIRRYQTQAAALPHDSPRPLDPLGSHEVLATIAAFRQDDSGQHGNRVGILTRLLALALGDSAEEAQRLGYAARFHDIGLSAIPKETLNHPRPLSARERQTIEAHSHTGYTLLAATHNPEALLAQNIARYHHEHWDGSGYPEGIAGTAIPRAARLCAVADVFDALTSPRPHRPALSYSEALRVLAEMAGRQLDPALTQGFIDSAQSGLIRHTLTGLRNSYPPSPLDDLLLRIGRPQ
ncbi:MAG: HD domain-containing protein [Betaproteobacteria bacterium]|nr:HD domain-containing protein [Betaproteobacteria bacterium]